jgi:hypothetical protein
MWISKVKVKDRSRDLVRVTAVHTDDTSDKVDFRYECLAIISSQAQRTAVFQLIKQKYTAYINNESTDEVFLAGLAQTLTNGLNAWENE